MTEFKACKECTTDRHVGCHSTCERHKREKEEHRKNIERQSVDREYRAYQLGSNHKKLSSYASKSGLNCKFKRPKGD